MKKKAAPEKSKAAPSDLPSSVTSRLKKIDTSLSAAEAALKKNQLQSATRKVGEAKKLMNEIQTRYSAKIPDGNEQMKAATERLKSVEAKVSDADASAAKAAAAKARVKELMESQSMEWVEKFSQFFDYKSDLYLRMGAEFNRASESEKQKCKEAYAEADDLMPTYKKTEFPHGKTQELTNLEQRLFDYLTRYNEQEARARQEQSCRKWVETFRSYVDVGAGSRKYLVVGATACEDEINKRSALLKEARALWPDYRKAEFPLMTTQAAAKEEDGKVYLHSVHLASDRKADGTWGGLYGHVMWSDWIAEKNVHK
ncbi:MAG: hypothetical protein U9O82_05880 [Thermodesulfobacteriota bacterium]|nr:hypothetical protein [Thermodesulfobacteriota bacterium]